MKPVFEKRIFLRYLSVFLCIFSAFVLFILTINFVPNAVSYSVSKDSTDKARAANAVSQKEDASCLYDSLFDIENDGPFCVKSDGEEIYILCEEKRLYRINANLSDFPETDRLAIETGIHAKDKRELFEIVSYMES